MFQKHSMDLQAAMQMAESILSAVQPGDPPIAVAVVDEACQLVYCERMDGVSPNDIRQARRKAYTASFMEKDSGPFGGQIAGDGRTAADWADPMVTTLPGGLVVRYQGKRVGGIGVSGASPERDEELARLGLKAIGLEESARARAGGGGS